MSPFSLTAFLE